MAQIVSEVKDNGETLFIKIDGVFSFELNRQFSDTYRSAPESVERFVIDFSQVEYVDSSALGILLVMKKTGEEHGVNEFSLINCRQNIADVMLVCHFDDIFNLTRLEE